MLIWLMYTFIFSSLLCNLKFSKLIFCMCIVLHMHSLLNTALLHALITCTVEDCVRKTNETILHNWLKGFSKHMWSLLSELTLEPHPHRRCDSATILRHNDWLILCLWLFFNLQNGNNLMDCWVDTWESSCERYLVLKKKVLNYSKVELTEIVTGVVGWPFKSNSKKLGFSVPYLILFQSIPVKSLFRPSLDTSSDEGELAIPHDSHFLPDIFDYRTSFLK